MTGLRPPRLNRGHSSSLPLLAHDSVTGGNENIAIANDSTLQESRVGPIVSNTDGIAQHVGTCPSDQRGRSVSEQLLLPIFTSAHPPESADHANHSPNQVLWVAAHNLLIWSLPLTIFLLSIGGAILLYNRMSMAQWGKLDLGVQFRCGEQANRFVNELTTSFLAPVHTIRSFLLTQPTFDQETLNRFCSIGGWGPLLRLVIAQQVSNADRSSWEQQHNVTIAEVDQVLFPNGSSFISAVRPREVDGEQFYFPTRFYFPDTASKLLGFDQHYGPRKGGFKSSLNIPSDRVEATTGALTDAFPLVAGTGAPETVRHPIGIAYYAPLLPPRPDGSIWSIGGGFNIETFISQTIAPEQLERLGLRIVVKVNGTLVYETPVNIASSDTHIRAKQEFEIAGQMFGVECISTAIGAAFYVTGWRYIAPCLLAVSGWLVAVVLFQFLSKHRQLSQASRTIGSWKRYSEAILRATPNPMISVDENGRISGLNKAFLDLTGYSVATLYERSALTDIISLCPPNSLLDTCSQHEVLTGNNIGDEGDNSISDHHTSPTHSVCHILQPGKHEVRIWVSSAMASSIGADYIEAMAAVSARTSSKMSQVLVFTDLTEAKQRDAKLAHLVRMTDHFNAQQAHVLTYLAHELAGPVAEIDAARRVAEEPDKAAVGSAHCHLVEMHQAVAELVGVSKPWREQASLTQVTSTIAIASGSAAGMTISYSNVDVQLAATIILEPASSQSILKFVAVAHALKASEIVFSVLAPGKLTVQCTLPDSTPDEDLEQLNPEFDWTGLGRGCDFALLGIHLVILRQQLALAQGSLSRNGRRLSMAVPWLVQ